MEMQEYFHCRAEELIVALPRFGTSKASSGITASARRSGVYFYKFFHKMSNYLWTRNDARFKVLNLNRNLYTNT
jgi:hypothetical protein